MPYQSRVYVAGKLAWSGTVENVYVKPVMTADEAAARAFRSAGRTPLVRTVASKPLPAVQAASQAD